MTDNNPAIKRIKDSVDDGIAIVLPPQEARALASAFEQQQEEILLLKELLEQIKRHWQDGIGENDNPWRRRMAELVGDDD
jgi:hypothetical protein